MRVPPIGCLRALRTLGLGLADLIDRSALPSSRHASKKTPQSAFERITSLDRQPAFSELRHGPSPTVRPADVTRIGEEVRVRFVTRMRLEPGAGE